MSNQNFMIFNSVNLVFVLIFTGVAGLTLNGVRQPVYTPPPVTTTPLVSNILSPPVPAHFTRSTSTPSFTSDVVSSGGESTVHSTQIASSGTVHAKSTENLSGKLGQPLFDLKDHSFEPVRTAHLHSIRSTAEIGDHLIDDHHDHHASPQIFHPITPPVTTAPSVPSYEATSPAVPPLGHVTPPPPLPYHPPVGHVTPPPLYPVHGQSPIPPTIPIQGGGVANQLPPVHSMTPPPPPGNRVVLAGSLSAGNTPRSTSPSGAENNGDSVHAVDDKEGLKITMDALQDVINKLHDTLEVSSLSKNVISITLTFN